MRSQRIDTLYEYIFDHKTVSIDELCDKFAISKSTLRRDLDILAKRGVIRKNYGGVTSEPIHKTRTPNFEERHIVNAEAKRRIAKKAVALVEDGDVIFIDSGSTGMSIIDFLEDRRNLTILTNNINIVMKAIPLTAINVITLSGALNRRTFSFTGETAAQMLTNYNISKAFMGTTGFSLDSGVTNTSSTEIAIKRTAVERSRQAFILADHTKAGVVSLFTYCRFKDVDALITDAPLSPEYGPALAEWQCEVLIAE